MDEHRAEGVTGMSTAYRDPKVSHRVMPLARQSLRLNLLPGEAVLGLFAVTRLRRSVTLLVVTDRRLLTLGDQHVGMPVVDEIPRGDVVKVHVEREKIFSTGVVTVDTVDGEVSLGTLTYGPDTFNRLEELLAATPPRALPVIPVAQSGMENGAGPTPEDLPRSGAGSHGQQGSTHPLVLHLTALADLHERGALDDEEFAAAKARLLADPHD